mgnify:CR=1 FL=1
MTKAEHRKALIGYKEYVIGMFDKININRYENLNALLDKKSSKHHIMIKEYHLLGKKLHKANDVIVFVLNSYLDYLYRQMNESKAHRMIKLCEILDIELPDGNEDMIEEYDHIMGSIGSIYQVEDAILASSEVTQFLQKYG